MPKIPLFRRSESISSAIHSLKEIVTIIFAVTTTHAMVLLITGGEYDKIKPLGELRGLPLALFGLLMFNVIRFYHGNIRHLDDTYLAMEQLTELSDAKQAAGARLHFDFFVVFFESILFAGMSFYINLPYYFTWLFVTVLFVDIVWALASMGRGTNVQSVPYLRNWLVNNFVFFAMLLVLVVLPVSGHGPFYHYLAASFIAANTAIDFGRSWWFYFPQRRKRSSEAAPIHVFLAAPFTEKRDKNTGKFPEAYRKRLETIMRVVEQRGHRIFCCHREENWGKTVSPPKEAVARDYENICRADLVVAYVEEPYSFGVSAELGIAVACKKTVVVLIDAKVPFPYFAEGFESLTEVRRIEFDTEGELVSGLETILPAVADR